MKVLIGYDGSQCADSALNDLTHAGLPDDGESQIVTVAAVWLPPPSSAFEALEMTTVARETRLVERKYMVASQAVQGAGEMAARAADIFKSSFPNWKVSHEGTWGSPSWELFSRAEQFKADLIVVGSHGRSALGRFFLGSISQWLLNAARCSVRIARGKLDEPDFPVRLMVALDGSRSAEKALEAVAARNWPDKSEVRVVTVNQPLEATYVGQAVLTLTESIDEINQQELHKSQRLVDTAVKKLRATGLRATGQVVPGDPKKELIRVAEEWRADSIFLGATGLTNRFEKFLLGSTAGAVAARAHCSVEIVRRRRRSRKSNGNGN
jgi:nucleotide-binding universal stress UspA family protein